MVECVQVGQEVPDFELETYDPKTGDFSTVSLEKLKADGRWAILFFYPADFTFVCATEFAALAELHERFDKLGAEVITVSCDTKFSHLAWTHVEKELGEAKFQMAADPTGKMAKMFGIYDENAGVALRGTYIINPSGVLINAEVNYLNLGRNVEELMRKFKANLYLARKQFEACPAKWKDDGDVTLTPSARMVGMVHQALQQGGKI